MVQGGEDDNETGSVMQGGEGKKYRTSIAASLTSEFTDEDESNVDINN